MGEDENEDGEETEVAVDRLGKAAKKGGNKKNGKKGKGKSKDQRQAEKQRKKDLKKMPKRRTRGKTKNHRGKAAVAIKTRKMQTTKTKIKIRRILRKKETVKERTQGRTATQSLRREGRTVMGRARRWLDPCQESRAWRER